VTSPVNERFVEHIVRRCDDLGVRADLRSGIAIPIERAPRMHAHVAAWTHSDRPHETVARYTVAALIARNPKGAIPDESPGNLGASFAASKFLKPKRRAREMDLVCAQTPNRLPVALGRVVATMRDHDVPVDFTLLLADIAGWPWRRREIRRRWLQSYYRITEITDDDDN
jgi:CRISPR system Cascade subunit CasB